MTPPIPGASTLQRSKVACLRCRNKKMKCNGSSPCNNCAYWEQDCVYEERRKSSFSEKALLEKLATLQSRYDALTLSTSTFGFPESPSHARTTSSVGFPSRNEASESSLPTAPSKIPHINAHVTEDVAEFLIRIAMLHLPRCHFDIDPNVIWEALKLPAERRPHAALIHAIMLFGTYYAATTPGHPVPADCPPSEYFVQEIRAQMAIALSETDRLIDYMSASTMLSWWFVQNARWLEAHVEISSTARLGIACGLHQLDEQTVKSVLYPETVAAPLRQVEGILGSPTSISEFEKRVDVFWGIYLGDRIVALMTGLPAAFDERTSDPKLAITTVFQRGPGRYTDPWGPNDFCSIDDLMGFSQVPSTTPEIFKPIATPQTTFCAYAQGITLLLRGIRLSSRTPRNLQEALDNREALATLNQAMQRFTSQLPREVTIEEIQRSPPPYAFGATQAYPAFFCLAEIRCGVYVIVIRMHQAAEQLQAFAGGEQGLGAGMCVGDEKKMEAAHEATDIADQILTELSKPECNLSAKDGLCVVTGYLWATIAEVYVERIAKLHQTLPTDATKAELHLCSTNLLKLIDALKRLSQVFPILELQAQKVDLMIKETIGSP